MRRHPRARPPLPLLLGFGLFVAVIAWLLAASLTRRDAPTYAPSAPDRERAADWAHAGDTLTLDATDGERWHRVSLARGRALASHDGGPWELAVRRYRITVAGELADLGPVPFERARLTPAAAFVASSPTEAANAVIRHWYHYSVVTHLLETDGHVYALRGRDGALWKLQVLGYYCPGLVAGCLTLRYARLEEGGGSRTGARP